MRPLDVVRPRGEFGLAPQDIYAAFRTLGNVRKVSIHYPRQGLPRTLRYIGYTKDFAERRYGRSVNRRERTDAEWRGLDLGNGYFIEFRFRIPECELRLLDDDGSKDVLWLCPPPTGAASEVTILSGPSTHVGLPPKRADDGTVDCIAELSLKNGRRVWILHHHIPAPPEEVMQSYRDRVRREICKQEGLDTSKPISRNARINLTMDCEDGSAAEVELSGDFLRKSDLHA